MALMHGFSHKAYNTNNLIYHYCSLDVFKLIIENATLRLTNIVKSNDLLEIKHALKTITSVMYHTCTKEAKERANPYLQQFVENFDFDLYFNNLVDESNLSYYAVCFSMNSDLLSQWRGYANNGNGIAIGFHASHFKKFQNNPESSIAFGEICYDENDLVYEIKNFFRQRLDTLDQNDKTVASDYENIFFDLTSKAIYSSVFYKDRAFSEEAEKRLVYYPFGNIRSLRKRNSYSDDITNYRYFDRMIEHFDRAQVHHDFTISSPSFFVRDNQLVSCFDLSFEKIKKYILAEIILGPKTDIDDNDLRLFLLSCGYDLNYIDIHKSKAPYK